MLSISSIRYSFCAWGCEPAATLAGPRLHDAQAVGQLEVLVEHPLDVLRLAVGALELSASLRISSSSASVTHEHSCSSSGTGCQPVPVPMGTTH